MTKTKDKALTRPKVQVTIPQVKLRLQDLAFLRSIAQPKAIRCHANSNVLDRLRFLDLIARAHVQPTDSEKSSAAAKKAIILLDLNKSVAAEEWDVVSQLSYQLRQLERSLEPRQDDVLTDKGRQILRTGEADVRVRSVGCVSA